MTGTGPSRPMPPILLVRLLPQQPDGTVIGESRRVCHIVPLRDSGSVPPVLRAYCGLEIAPDTAEVLDWMSGMPCVRCVALAPSHTVGMRRGLLLGTGPAPAAESELERDPVSEWSDLALRPDRKITARFALLVLLQEPARPMSVAEITQRLGQDPYKINMILLLHASLGWVTWSTDQARQGWTHLHYRLTERGATRARRLLAQGMTSTFALLADRLGLNTTITTTADTTDPGGCRTPPPRHPPGTTTEEQPDDDADQPT